MKKICVTEMKNHARRLWSAAQSHDFPITYYDNAIMNYILDVIVLDRLPKKYEAMTTGEILDDMPHTESLETLRELLAECKSARQARKAIRDCGFYIEGDDSAEVGCFSVWLSENLRVYKRLHFPGYTLQIWN